MFKFLIFSVGAAVAGTTMAEIKDVERLEVLGPRIEDDGSYDFEDFATVGEYLGHNAYTYKGSGGGSSVSDAPTLESEAEKSDEKA